MKFIVFCALTSALVLTACSLSAPNITEEDIIAQLPADSLWLEVEPNRPNSIAYKLRKKGKNVFSDFASIAVRRINDRLFGHFKARDYDDAQDLLAQHSFEELATIIETAESRDERAIPRLISAECSNLLEGYRTIELSTDYTMKETDAVVAIHYFVLKTRKGWMTLSISFHRPDEAKHRSDLRLKLAKIKLP